ncbi:hypothetical protein FGG08_004208 [Glutinoglossum americanum]|uniref:DH domain-containing protein n=1 Tax=Glutinoglossum americanum TaxID=1670608 RepID=A0A9P8L2X7_9PEZI|nr:hypothetical protein FGG08_004208 [Glutinoglossum americanum]
MACITNPLPSLSPESLTLFYTTDPLLSNSPILVFHGPSTTTNSTFNSSRIQAHVFTPAGFQTYPRITISPSSPLYAAVNHLPREQQGDEVCRGLAVSLLKYFSEMPEVVRTTLSKSGHGRARNGAPPVPVMFDEMHAGDLASRMVKVGNISDVIRDIKAGLAGRALSHVDMDVVLPPGSISDPQAREEPSEDDEDMDDDPSLRRYGEYAPLIKLLGTPAFIPTSKLRRAPSKPTTLGRSRSFLKHQKESVRREMCEIVDTEERYVSKIYELVHDVASEFRQKAKGKSAGSSSPNENSLERLFPPCLDQIFDVNSHFLNAIRAVLDETENEAIADIQADMDAGSTGSRTGKAGRVADATGAVAFSKVLLHWFPKFASCYAEYMRASTEFPQILSGFLRDGGSSFSKRVQQTGEQRLRSMLIEPVQRLPRYSLFIDNIVNCLPVTHPALQPLLKSRDIITDICSLDLSSSAEKSQVVDRLKNLIASWPPLFRSQGRLISAADFAELPPPYNVDCDPGETVQGMFLLFADFVVIIRKGKGSNMTARGIIAEVDRPSVAAITASVATAAGSARAPQDLFFSGWFDLGDVRFSESTCGRMIWMTYLRGPFDSGAIARGGGPGVRAFRLAGAYEGKASRWSEEIAKARIEGRYTEQQRECDKWALRNVVSRSDNIGVWSAIFQEGEDDDVQDRNGLAMIRMVVNEDKGSKGIKVGARGVEISISIDFGGIGMCCLEVDGLNDYASVDNVSYADLSTVLFKKISNLLRLQNQPQNPTLTASILSMNRKILRSLTFVTSQVDGAQPRFRNFRPPSPVKLLSTFLGGGGSVSGPPCPPKPRHNTMGDIPSMLPPLAKPPSSTSGIKKHAPGEATQNITVVGDDGAGYTTDPFRRLEETFRAYTLALHLRKGNVVDKVLRGRVAADELCVNELYNTLMEDPSGGQATLEVAVDVLFVAFEKFLKLTWKDQMGPVVSVQTLKAIQDKSDVLLPGDFEDCFRMALGDMAPQNRRAFKAIIKLLAYLLDGAGNDGDKGALTAAFTELLVIEGPPHRYISLLDRLVEDYDRLFNESPPGSRGGDRTPLGDSVNSMKRIGSTNTGSISSNASSFRKRFGFNTLSRENSKIDSESKVGSVWRTLSKSARSAVPGELYSANSSNVSLVRSKSIDLDHQLSPAKRPASRDRPTIFGTFSHEDPDRPGSSHLLNALDTITASPLAATTAAKAPTKKRRSSLSDLKILNGFGADTIAPLTPRKPNTFEISASPRTLSPVKGPTTTFYGADLPGRKENVSNSGRSASTERTSNTKPDGIAITELRQPRGASGPLSSIPALKATPRDKLSGNEIEQSHRNVPSSPQKLRMQSPQKLRERLQNEQKAITCVEDALQAEISKIGEDMSSVALSHPQNRLQTADIRRLLDRVNQLESKIPVFVADLTARNTAIKNDLESSLTVSERKAKKLDELYREANAENEILYDRFNDELGKMMSALKIGSGEKELAEKLREVQGELSTYKKENARLKRENVGLRAQLKGD